MNQNRLPKYLQLKKRVGETPLQCVEEYRAKHPELLGVPLAYAGRLDPMASGELLILVGDECKRQTQYHTLDKEYEFSVLFGVSSDTGDVMGRLTYDKLPHHPNISQLTTTAEKFSGKKLTLPYPHFSSKTVKGIPLHTWTVSGKSNEIEIPTYTATLYNLSFISLEYTTGTEVTARALKKINSLPPVTDPKKSLGNDFRRDDIRADWYRFIKKHGGDRYVVATFRAHCSSGLYMRSLAECIANEYTTHGLAFHIHRTHIFLPEKT